MKFKRKPALWEHVLLHHCLIETIDLEPWRHEGHLYCNNVNCTSPKETYLPTQEEKFKRHLFLTCEGRYQKHWLPDIVIYDLDPADLRKIHILSPQTSRLPSINGIDADILLTEPEYEYNMDQKTIQLLKLLTIFYRPDSINLSTI